MSLPETVVDASVVVKWFLPEPSRPKALMLLRDYREERVQLVAPALLLSEVSNVFCKRVRRGTLTAATAKQAYRLLHVNAPMLVDDRQLIDQAVDLSLLSGQAVYDCLYLSLAIRRGCNLVTADQKFQSAVGPGFSNVVFL